MYSHYFKLKLVTVVILLFCLISLFTVDTFAACVADSDCGTCGYCRNNGSCTVDLHCQEANVRATGAAQSQRDASCCNDACHYACSNTYTCGNCSNCSPPGEPPAPPPSQPLPPPPTEDRVPEPPPAPAVTPLPSPTSTPIPTATPNPPTPTATPTNTPSPTPRLPTRIITQSTSYTQQANKFAAALDVSPPEALQQVCLRTDDCSIPASSCSTAVEHRVKLSQKDQYRAIPGQSMYIVECLLINGNKVCTTGDTNSDNSLFGPHDGTHSNLQYLQSEPIKYEFKSFLKVTPQGVRAASNPIVADSTGNLGVFEWESRTKDQYERLFFGVSDASNTLAAKGHDPSQKQGTFVFDAGVQNCVVIAWDPHGVVYDAASKKPIGGAEVTLWQVSGGYYAKATADLSAGTFKNPVVTEEDGKYMFHVKDGMYMITVEKNGYVYKGYKPEPFEQIATNVEVNIPMKASSDNIVETIIYSVRSLLKWH